MAQKNQERISAQLPPELHQWASGKASELDVSIADIWRGLLPVLVEAERQGIRVIPYVRQFDVRIIPQGQP